MVMAGAMGIVALMVVIVVVLMLLMIVVMVVVVLVLMLVLAVHSALLDGAAAITPTAVDWIGLALIAIVLPAVLSWVFGLICRKLGWIKDGDMKLN